MVAAAADVVKSRLNVLVLKNASEAILEEFR